MKSAFDFLRKRKRNAKRSTAKSANLFTSEKIQLQDFRNFAEYLFTYYFRAPTYGAPAHHGEECTKVTCGFNNKYQNLQDDHHRDYYDHEGSRGGL